MWIKRNKYKENQQKWRSKDYTIQALSVPFEKKEGRKKENHKTIKDPQVSN